MKNRILNAAALELNSRGTKFTMNSVASRLGISKKTLYAHFPSKDAIIAGIFDVVLEDIADQRQAILTSEMSLSERLTAILTMKPRRLGKINEAVLSDIRQAYSEEWLKVQKFHREQLAVILDLLEQGKAAGEIRNVNSHVAAVILMSSVAQLLEQDFLAEQNLTISGALQSLTDLFLNGVLNTAKSQYGGAA